LLKTPIAYRQRLAAKARRTSAEHKQRYNEQQQSQIMDVTPEEVPKVMAQFGVTRLIHGHTHRPAVHQVDINGVPGQRYVLGDWYSQSSYLAVSADKWDLVFTPLTDH